MSASINALPAVPTPSDTPANFNSKAFNLFGALPGFVNEANALSAEVSSRSAETATAAASASGSKDAAAASAGAASASAASATDSMNAAGTSASGASASKTAAAASQTAAAGSATAAAASATTATNQATTATGQAANAASSATAAAASQSACATSATNASSSATAAANSATTATNQAATATNQATAAASSATASATSATNAASSATNASGSASTATTQANNASTSAAAAGTSATAAAASQSAAATSASGAATSETNAGNSATAAATSAGQAATSATNAGNSASAASVSATAAAGSAANAATSADSAKRYQGPAANNPTMRLDGSAIQEGDTYFNTVVKAMRVYNSAAWQDQAASADTVSERSFLATAGQTSYTFTGGYRVGYTYVWVNGSMLYPSEFTATDGTTITFVAALALNSTVRILSIKAVGTVAISDISGLQTALDAKLALTGGSLTGGLREAKTAVAASAIDISLGNYFTKTISSATTFTVSNVPATGTAASIILDLTNGGAFAITWWSGVKWVGGTAPTLTAAGRDVLGFFTHDGGTTWSGLVLGKDVK